jgi:hypothetical protein
MRDMTDDEYAALDKRLTDTVPTLGPNGTGFFSRKGSQVVCLDERTAQILNAKAIASRQTPSEIIASMLRKELMVANVES